ncbi:MAG: metal-sensitive transcriptional regulator [Candidatus Hermodarchaeia archaeon]
MRLKNEFLDQENLADILRRLRCVEGHVRGIARMVEDSEPCPSVLRQVVAVQGSLSKVGKLLTRDYIKKCLLETNQDDKSKELSIALAELSEILIDARNK